MLISEQKAGKQWQKPPLYVATVEPDFTTEFCAIGRVVSLEEGWSLISFLPKNKTGKTRKLLPVDTLVLEVLISVKDRRKPIPGITPEGVDDSLSLRELIERVAERGHQFYGWSRGLSKETCVNYHLRKNCNIILDALNRIQKRFRCLVFSQLESWGELEARISLTKSVTLSELIPHIHH
jgi:hypothetical protein